MYFAASDEKIVAEASEAEVELSPFVSMVGCIRLWSEEKDKMEDAGAVSGDQLRSVGISPGDIEADMNTADDLGVDTDTEETGAEGEDTEAATDET